MILRDFLSEQVKNYISCLLTSAENLQTSHEENHKSYNQAQALSSSQGLPRLRPRPWPRTSKPTPQTSKNFGIKAKRNITTFLLNKSRLFGQFCGRIHIKLQQRARKYTLNTGCYSWKFFVLFYYFLSVLFLRYPLLAMV